MMNKGRAEDLFYAVLIALLLFSIFHLALEKYISQEAVSPLEAECRAVCDAHNDSFCGYSEVFFESGYDYCLCSEALPCLDESLLMTIHKKELMLLSGDE